MDFLDILIDFWGRFSGCLKWHFSDFKMHFGVSGLCRGTGRLQCQTWHVGVPRTSSSEMKKMTLHWERTVIGYQNLYTNTARRGPQQPRWRLFGVYVFSSFFPWKQAFWYTPNLFFACWGTWVFRAENTFGVYFFPPKVVVHFPPPQVWNEGPIYWECKTDPGPV